MQELVEVQFPDGQIVWARVETAVGPEDVGLADVVHAIKGLPQVLSAIAANVRDGLCQARPDETSVEFGVEFALGNQGLVAALVGVSGSANIRITLTWNGAPHEDANE